MRPATISEEVAMLRAMVQEHSKQIAALCTLVSGLPADMPETMPMATYQANKTQRMMRVARQFAISNGLRVEDLRGPSHEHDISHPRQDLMAELHKQGFSTIAIGKFLGGRDSSTVLYGIRRSKARKEEAGL